MANAAPDLNAEIEALKRRLAELEAARATPASQDVNTQGGTAIEGGVQTQGGYFIGRDYVQIVHQLVQHGEEREEALSVVGHYLEVLANDLAGLKLGEIDNTVDQTKNTPLRLADIYVPLDTTLWIPKQWALPTWLAKGSDRMMSIKGEKAEARPVSVLEALALHPRLILLGKPGSGKSTFGTYVLLVMAQAWQGHGGELAALGPEWHHGALLPIRVTLRRFAESLPAGDAPARAGDLWAFIGKDLQAGSYGLSSLTLDYVRRIARNQGALILLDGLDECGDESRRGRVLAAVEEFMRTAGEHCRFLLTARPYAWPTGPDPVAGAYRLDDLNDERIEQFIESWYAALVRREWRSTQEAEPLKQDLLLAWRRADLVELARTPLLLTLMATLHSNRGHLPDDRADLYHESVELLLQHWNRKVGAEQSLITALQPYPVTLPHLRKALERLAFETHERSVGTEGAADIAEHHLLEAFRRVLGGSRDKAAVVVDYIEKRAGLLLGLSPKDGEAQFCFPHRTFQEFLAACHLAGLVDFPSECARLARAHGAHWREVLPLAARVAGAERGASAADELIGSRLPADLPHPQVADWQNALMAGRQLLEIGTSLLVPDERPGRIKARVAAWLVAGLPVPPKEGGLPAAERLLAGDVLAALGDPRFDADRFWLPKDGNLGFVRIPADPDYRIGTRRADKKKAQADDDEINDDLTPTPEFFIGRYPVSVAQFRAYLQAAGREAGDADALADPDNRPVRYVDWHEALAYCRWLHEQLATSPALAVSEAARLVRQAGWRVSLPSELEWEKAARGGMAGTVYPWGNEFASSLTNTGESELGTTSPVGMYPANTYELHDMVGNVWEWTRSHRQPYPYDDIAQREALDAGDEVRRLVRGGAWNLHQYFARCAIRHWSHPDFRYGYLGFRVVLCSSPV